MKKNKESNPGLATVLKGAATSKIKQLHICTNGFRQPIDAGYLTKCLKGIFLGVAILLIPEVRLDIEVPPFNYNATKSSTSPSGTLN